jgi:ubiquinone/menaquinone biosynthesis C-methylase UbiE
MQDQGATTAGNEGRLRLSPLYDAALALLAREGRWRAALARQIGPEPHDVILDGFCGAGALCLTLARLEPEAEIVGLDPRTGLVAQARARAAEAGLRLSFIEGAPSEAALYLGQRTPTKIVLTLIGAPSAAEKLAQLQGARQIVDPAGALHVIDFGRQHTALMRGLFQARGGADTGDAATLIRAAGFVAVEETAAWPTASGVISLFRARAS